MSSRACPACGIASASPVTHVDIRPPDGHPLQGGYVVVSCDNCGTGFADVVPPNAFYEAFYRSEAKYAAEDLGEWAKWRAKETTERIVERTQLPEGARILDIGSGNGLIVEGLRWRGFDAIGLDPSGANGALAGSFSKMPDDIGTFDAVLLVGVLEHIWNVDEAMMTLVSLLKPHAHVYLEVPDAEAYATAYLGPFEDFNTEHINHFSDQSLRTLAMRFGFDASIRSERIAFAEGVEAQCLVQSWRRWWDGSGLRSALASYTARSNSDLADINDRLETEMGSMIMFNLWGAGECAYRFLALPALKRRMCEQIVDIARQGMKLRGMRVGPPEALRNNDSPIVVASMVRRDAILRAAKELGINSGRIVNIQA